MVFFLICFSKHLHDRWYMHDDICQTAFRTEGDIISEEIYQDLYASSDTVLADILNWFLINYEVIFIMWNSTFDLMNNVEHMCSFNQDNYLHMRIFKSGSFSGLSLSLSLPVLVSIFLCVSLFIYQFLSLFFSFFLSFFG